MKKGAPEEGGDVTGTIGTEIGGNRRDGARRRVKKDEDDIEDDRQNCIPTITTTTLPSASSPIVPDPICSNSSCSGGMNSGNTEWRPYTGYRDDDDPNDAVDDVAVGTGTNKQTKSDQNQSRDHLKRKKSKRSIQATNNSSTIFNSDDNATNDGMQDNDDDDDNYYNNDDNNSVVVVTDTTTTDIDDEDSEELEYDEDSDATDEGINDYDDPNYADSDKNQKRKRTSAGCRRGSGSAPNKKRAKVQEVEVVAEVLLEEEEDEHPLEPTEEELNQTSQKKYLRGWYKKCNELKTYRKKHGHCNVPKKDPKLRKVSKRNIYSCLTIPNSYLR